MPAPIAIPSGCQPNGSAILSGNEPFASAAGASNAAATASRRKRRMACQRVAGAGLSPTVISKIRAA